MNAKDTNARSVLLGIALIIIFFALAESANAGGEYNWHWDPIPGHAARYDSDTFTLKCHAGDWDIYVNTNLVGRLHGSNPDSQLTFEEAYVGPFQQGEGDGAVRRFKAIRQDHPFNEEPIWQEDFVAGTCIGCATNTDGGNAVVLNRGVIFIDDAHPTPPPPNTKCNDHKSGGNSCSNCTGQQDCQKECLPMAQYSIHSMLVSLNVQDTPLRYTPPFGLPINFTVTYNERDSVQRPIQSYSNLGPKWTFGWLSYVIDQRNVALPTVTVYVPGGGAEIFRRDESGGCLAFACFLPDPQSHAVLTQTGIDSYEKQLPDGTIQVFDHPSNPNNPTAFRRKVFMTEIRDPANNPVQINYVGTRIASITDALGQQTDLLYELASDPFKITKVVEPTFGDPNHTRRHADFVYENGLLKTITDEITIQSVFDYLPGTDIIWRIKTPYGVLVQRECPNWV